MEEEQDLQEPWYKGPIRYILGILLILLILAWYLPTQAVKIDPEPRNIPSLQEVKPNIVLENSTQVTSRQDYLKLLIPNDPVIKQTADIIVTSSCEGNKICYAKAIYYFVRDNFQYVNDPRAFEYVKGPKESLVTTGGDCDDAAVLAANLLQAVGIRTRFVFIPGHVYVQAYLPEAASRYKVEEKDFVSLDLTCNSCSFGELPNNDFTNNKQILG